MLRKTGTALLLSISISLAACNHPEKNTGSQSAIEEKLDARQDTTQAPVATGDNSQNSVDWNGTYEATLPCADCPGIKTILTLVQDNTFTISSSYLEDKTRSTVTEDKGTITWQNNGSIIHLKGGDTDHLLKVGENKLYLLDDDGKEIDGALKDQYIFLKR